MCVVCCGQDYLSAPMPFLMGIHAPNLFMSTLRSSAMEEVVVVDLDRGTTTASSLHSNQRGGNVGSRGESALPWGRQLEAALALLHLTLRSPIEYESTPVIAALMQARPAPVIHPCPICASSRMRKIRAHNAGLDACISSGLNDPVNPQSFPA